MALPLRLVGSSDYTTHYVLISQQGNRGFLGRDAFRYGFYVEFLGNRETMVDQ